MNSRSATFDIVHIGLLADHPDMLSILATALEHAWPEWYGVHGDATADLRSRSRRSGLPIALIALEDGAVVGALAIAEKCLPSHTHLSPWIIAFWVEPSWRNRGIGARLLSAACEHARRERVSCLYAATASAARLFIREGWSKIGVGTTELRHETGIFTKPLD